ncbi:hypothetical protein Bca101_058231 [Brassica carinata]
MGIRFILMVNKQGQTRLAQYYEWLTLEERRALEGEIVRKCLARNDQQVNLLFLFKFYQIDPDFWFGSRIQGSIDVNFDLLGGLLDLIDVEFLCSSIVLNIYVDVLALDKQCSFVEHRNYKIVYRRYASLFFMVGVDDDENELAILEFIHLLVETMDKHFGNVCELDIMFHLEKAHFMLEEMVMNGCIVETSKANILSPIQLMDKAH